MPTQTNSTTSTTSTSNLRQPSSFPPLPPLPTLPTHSSSSSSSSSSNLNASRNSLPLPPLPPLPPVPPAVPSPITPSFSLSTSVHSLSSSTSSTSSINLSLSELSLTSSSPSSSDFLPITSSSSPSNVSIEPPITTRATTATTTTTNTNTPFMSSSPSPPIPDLPLPTLGTLAPSNVPLTPPSTTSPMHDVPDPPPLVLSNKHLKPGHKASILDFTVTLDLYRANASKTNDPQTQLEFVRFLLLAAPQFPNETYRLRKEAIQLAKKVAPQLDEAKCVVAECLELGYHRPPFPNPSSSSSSSPTSSSSNSTTQAYSKAFQWYLRAAKNHFPEAAYRVAVYYEQGRGVSKSFPRAVQFYQKAAAAGHPGAMYRLGIAELRGELGLPMNPRNGVKWLKHSASNATIDHPLALFELAQLHEIGIEHLIFVDIPYAIQLYMEAASQFHHSQSMFRLGHYYEHGKHVVKDVVMSFTYYLAAAEAGHAEAMFIIATWYLLGNEEAQVAQSDTLAFDWMYKSAELGFDKAVYAIGHFYESGVGVPKNLTLATQWYEKASKYPGFVSPFKGKDEGSESASTLTMERIKKGEKENCCIM